MKIKYFIAIALSVASGFALRAQETIREMELLTVNDQITTVITATEPVRFVDISTDRVAGDQPLSNTVRLKPKEGAEVNQDGDILDAQHTAKDQAAEFYLEKWLGGNDHFFLLRRSRDLKRLDLCKVEVGQDSTRTLVAERMNTYVENRNPHYTAGEWFFIDFSVENRTNIRFDIDQIRFKVEDKRKSRATNDQSVELSPALLLEQGTTFNRGYRNVAVLKKLTFPNDKVLTIEMSEKQVSGRTITLEIDYEDVLRADSFDHGLLEED